MPFTLVTARRAVPGDSAAVFEARAFPLYILIDREGKIAGRQDGSGGEAALRRLVARAGLETK